MKDIEQEGDIADENTKAQPTSGTPRASVGSVSPLPPVFKSYPDAAGQAVSRLNQAARLIAGEEVFNRRLPRASRLAPFHDISADIRRESTPLPKFSKVDGATDTHKKIGTPSTTPSVKAGSGGQLVGLRAKDAALPDMWPWMDAEVEEKENEDSWASGTDPLISRRFPNSAESARIEEEDIRRALTDAIPTRHNMARIVLRHSSVRLAFAILAILAVIALVVDGVLLSVVVVHPHHSSNGQNVITAPALMLNPNQVSLANPTQVQIVQVSIVNFLPGATVQLSHDLQEDLQKIEIGPKGSASATIMVDKTWRSGLHPVVAEDTSTHYTASTTLLVLGKGSSIPAHLQVEDQNHKSVTEATTLDFSAGVIGSNTIQFMYLMNSGSGSVTWTANSNQPWLLITPNQGTFSQSQTIMVAVQRTNLKPGKGLGTITISSNVGTPQPFKVKMGVKALSSTVGPVLALNPAVLAFTTTDGAASPPAQVLTLNNPGKQKLNWSLSINTPTTASTQIALTPLARNKTWLDVKTSTGQPSGSIAAGSSEQFMVSVNSSSLLPGSSLGGLKFTAQGAIDSPQLVGVSLTIQPHCGIVTSIGFLSFTAVQSKTNPGNQSLSLNTTASCAGQPVSWKAMASSTGWLTVTPTVGQLNGTTGAFISVGVNPIGQQARSQPYYGNIAITGEKSTYVVTVALIVQPPPPAAAPVMSASPLNLNFSYTQGQVGTKGQVVTITNSGNGQLAWSTSPVAFGPTWLTTSSSSGSGGTILPNQTAQLVVNVNTAKLSPGSYAGQITLNGKDIHGKPASGTGQVITVNLVVQPPCTLAQPSSSSLAFSSTQGSGIDPTAQPLQISATGNCTWPLILSIGTPSASWLNVKAATGSIKGSGQSASYTVSASNSLTAGIHNATFTISAVDSAGNSAQSSPQTISVTYTVLAPPCTSGSISSPTIGVIQGQSAQQSIPLNAAGSCTRPVTWSATSDSSWLTLTQPGADNGSGTSLGVTVNATSLSTGTYTGKITISAVDSNNLAVTGSSQTITVTANVTATISGVVEACSGADVTCPVSVPLPGASLTLVNSSNVTVATINADANGNYSFTGLANGSYTVNITGIDASNVQYSTSGITLNVSGSGTATLRVFPI